MDNSQLKKIEQRLAELEQKTNENQDNTNWNTRQIKSLMYLNGRNQDLEETLSFLHPDYN